MGDAKLRPGQVAMFLQDLAELSEEHGIVIAGCGCCGSPYLLPMPEGAGGGHRYRVGPVYLANGEKNPTPTDNLTHSTAHNYIPPEQEIG